MSFSEVSSQAASGPLAGILVADFSRVLAGPYAAMTLGDLGADVIKVERPGIGDDTRSWGPPWVDGVATYYVGLNRNKRSLTLDLANLDDRRLAVELAHRADVLIENFRPGTLDRYGLGYAELSASHPSLVYCSITGFGAATEAAADLSGYDLLVQAMSGLMSVTGQTGGEPTKVGVALIDHICALQATIGVMAALRVRERSGQGQRVEVSLMGSALAALLNQASAHIGAGVVPGRLGNRHPSIAPYQTFQASDGYFVVACGNDTQFARVVACVGAPQLASDQRFATNASRVAHVGELEALLGAAFVRSTVHDWVSQLSAAGVPSGPINDIGQAFVAASTLGLDPVVATNVAEGPQVGSVQRTVRSPIGLSANPMSVRRPAPALGEHDAELRRWLSNDE
jgi:crotonobetainyl-CoA:carnitine CoA-transferase CaiB-like acyl-CoA transferase